jgi:predicted dithiol-disulfide oxidoreductase (DUF899 family)
MRKADGLNEIQQTELEIANLVQKLETLRKDTPPVPVKNYQFKDFTGAVSLLELFGDKDTLFVIHNMGQACRFCTLWADGINGFLPHLEDQFSVVLLSKDDPETQRRFANSRGWRYRLVSHGDADYMKEHSTTNNGNNSPGLVVYTRKGKEIFKKNSSAFGPGDLFCSLWHILSLAGIGNEEWTPQYNYWKRPSKLEDGGKNVRDA